MNGKAADFKASENWLSKFMLRNNYSLKKRTNKKLKDQDDAEERIQRFHSSFRHMLLTHQPTRNDGTPFNDVSSPESSSSEDVGSLSEDDGAAAIPTAAPVSLQSKWGPYPPSHRAAVDQVPLPLVINTNIWASKGRGQVPVVDAINGMDKRFCTIQVIFFMDGRQPEIAVIFRGKGQRISATETASYADGIHVYWQKKVRSYVSFAAFFMLPFFNTSYC